MSQILVTGGTGFIGSHVVRRLCAEGHSVRVLARPASSLQLLESLPVQIAIGDLTNVESLRHAVAGCDTVFHVAADYRLWSADADELYRSNVAGTENILAAAFEGGVSRFIYTSTVGTIKFSNNGTPANEDSFPDPKHLSGHYKKSKFLAEQTALRYAREGHPVVIVNPTAPVGEGDRKPTETGKIVLDFLKRNMPAYIDTGLNLVDVRDVAEGHLAAMKDGRTGERYILGGRNLTFKEILDTLSRITGLPAPSMRIPYGLAFCAAAADTFLANITQRPPRAPLEGVKMARHKMWVTSAKAERELHYHPGSIETALERAVRWYRDNGYVPNT